MTTSLRPVAPQTARQWVEAGSAILVDIREPAEHARERIPGARLHPMSALSSSGLADVRERVVVFHCKSGGRTKANAERLSAVACREVYYLEGGIDAWKAAGLAVANDPSAPIELQRQVMIAAGGLVLLGLALGQWLSPWSIALSIFVAAGLVFAGVSGYCGMARFLMLMPWNRRGQAKG